jgi:asparagine synthase (glutamine-hydrolysing)
LRYPAQIAQALAAFVPRRVRSHLRSHAVIARADGWRDPFDDAAHDWRSVRGFSLDLISHTSLPMLLHWEDRNSMHFGVEARVPFLSCDVVTQGLAFTTDDKIRAGQTKIALRRALRSIVPDSILDRTDKVAPPTPEASWVCSDARTPKLLDRGLDAASDWIAPVQRARLHAMARRELPYDNAVWRVICFGAWRERFAVHSGS